MELEELYSNYLSGKGSVREALDQTDWFSTIADFDLLTREALPQTLGSVLQKVSNYKPYSVSKDSSSVLKDRLWRIIEHAREPLDNLLRNLNESPQRDHAVMPFYAVRELDTPSFMALARRPGSNICEKLAGKPYLQAVRRFQSVDLPENRLLKAFSERLADLLELRVEILHDDDAEELLYYIRSWLTTDEAQSISRWENLPPNNALLSHRDYRQIWDAWNWLQTLEESIENDLSNLNERRNIVQTWKKWGYKYAESRFRFAETPVLFDYDSFKIRLWTNEPHFKKTRPFTRPKRLPAINEPVCIDLTELYPRYAYLTSKGAPFLKTHPNSFIWQCWTNSDVSSQPEDFELFNSDAVYLHSDATTISIPELFFNHNHEPDHLKRAARAFSVKLQESFKNKVLIWLQPDYLNEFELKDIRSNINYCFPDAEPLPRSVAALFEKVDYNKITGEGYKVLVRDEIGGKLCETWFEAKYNKKLKKYLPEETRGYYWERQPPIVKSDFNSGDNENMPLNIVTFDMQGKWHEAQEPKRPEYIEENFYVINILDSPVCGGAKYYDMQRRAGGIPLWRDQIPALSIEVPDERYWSIQRRLPLVSKKTTVVPIRGKAVTIPVELDREFALPAGNPYYQFPLYMGKKKAEIGYSARLESSAFPLKTDLICDLKMTFTYGVDDPYSLVFIPKNDKSVPPIHVNWEKTVEEKKEVTNDPVPDYPEPMSWEELRGVPKRGGEETEDLLKQAHVSIQKLNNRLHPPKRVIGAICENWRSDINGEFITFARCPDIKGKILIHQDNFMTNCDFSNCHKNDYVSFHLNNRCGKYSASKIAYPEYRDPEYQEPNIIKAIHKFFYRPMIQIWCDGRSINDACCPPDYKYSMNFIINSLRKIIQKGDLSRTIKNEIMFLLSCSHKDAPDECIQWINEQIAKEEMYNYRAVGFALGDVSQPWQKNILNKLKKSDVLSYSSLRVFSYAIWHEQHFIEQLNYSDCQAILKGIMKMLANIKPCPKRIDKKSDWHIRNWVRSIAEPLELLLGMLRTRSSSNEEIRMLLQTGQEITKELIKLVERAVRIVADSKVHLFSRVQLVNLPQKPEGDHTPDLLYALLLFLRGNSLANTIRITGVSDSDEE